VVARGAREGDEDPYPDWHEAAEGLERSGIGKGRWRQSELDEKVLEARISGARWGKTLWVKWPWLRAPFIASGR
jgi:hypothetical protein